MIRTILAAGALALATVAALPAVAQPAPPPIEAYASLPALSNLALSPNGERIAFIGQAGTSRRLGVQTVTGEPLGVVDIGTQKVRSVRWADDDHVLIYTSSFTDIANFADDGEFYTAQSYNVRTRSFVTLLNRTVGGGSNLSSTRIAGGSGIVNVLAGPPFVHDVNGVPRTFVRSFDRNFRLQTFEVDLDTGIGTPRDDFNGVMGADGRAVARSQWDPERGRWWVSARRSVGLTQIWTSQDHMIDTPSLLGYGRTDQSVIVRVPEDGGDHLYEIPLDGSEPRKLAFGNVGEASPIYHPRNGGLLGFYFLGDNDQEYVFTDEAIGQAWASIKAAYPNRDVEMVSSTPDYSKFIISTQGASDTGTYHLVDLTAGRAVRIGSQYPAVPAEAIGEVRFINYAAADGTNIPAYLTLPPGREVADLPLIVMPHGGPQARDEPGFDYWAQLLASRGYAVLQPQFRGSVGFGKAHYEAGFGEWGRKMQTDLSDGVRHLAAEGVVDASRVCIWGWSYGGYAAMAGPTIDPGVYRCAAAGAGVSDLPRMLDWERDQTGGRDTPVMRYWKRFMGATRINDGSLTEVSPTRMVQNANVPILLIHGRDDSVVPYAQSEIFATALRRAGKDVEMVDLVGEDHWLSSASGRLTVFNALVPFLERHNPPR